MLKLCRSCVVGAACVALLASCDQTEFVGEPEAVASATASTGGAAAYDFIYLPTGGTPDRVLRALPSAGWYYYPDTLTGVPSDFQVFLQSTEGYLLHGLTISGGGEVFVVDNGAQISRIGESSVPTTGSVTYTGSYAAIVVTGVRDMSPETVSGAVTLNVDFDTIFNDPTVSGVITDRIYAGSIVADDVILVSTDLLSGAFAGTTTGGNLNSDGLSAANGTFNGLIVGPNSEEAIGSVTIVHDGTTTYTEHGGFILSE